MVGFPFHRDVSTAHAGLCVRAWRAHDRPVTSLLAVDRVHLVSGAANGQIRVWNSYTGQLLVDRQAHAGSVKILALLPQPVPVPVLSVPSSSSALPVSASAMTATNAAHAHAQAAPSSRRQPLPRARSSVALPVAQPSASSSAFSSASVASVSASASAVPPGGLAHSQFAANSASAPHAPATAAAFAPASRQFASVGNDADVCVWDAATGALVSAFHMSTAQESAPHDSFIVLC
jgi:WD40 repeat protein